MRKILFLDFDGVITSDTYTRKCIFEYRRENLYGLDWFDPACLGALRKVVDQTGAVIVVSSSWRELGMEKLARLWKELSMPGELYGTAPEWIPTKREAIARWLKENEWDRYVIVDDSEPGLANTFKTNPATGMTSDDADRIIEMFNRNS